MEDTSLNRGNSKSLSSSTGVDTIELQSEAEKPVADFILTQTEHSYLLKAEYYQL